MATSAEQEVAGQTIADKFRDGRVERAVQRAVREALAMHKALGHPIATWRDGKVVWIPPEEIPDPPSEAEP